MSWGLESEQIVRVYWPLLRDFQIYHCEEKYNFFLQEDIIVKGCGVLVTMTTHP